MGESLLFFESLLSLFTDAFNKCPASEIQGILEALSHINPDHGFRLTGLMVLKKALSFYPNATYYDIAQVDQHPLRALQIVKSGPHILICDGLPEKIISFNQQAGLGLDSATAPDYARFYLGHVVGPHGKSFVVDTVEDLMLEEEPTPSLRKTLNDRIVPFSLNASLGGGGYQMRGTLLIEKTLYSAFIDVAPEGQIQARIGKVLAESLPVVNRVLEG